MFLMSSESLHNLSMILSLKSVKIEEGIYPRIISIASTRIHRGFEG